MKVEVPAVYVTKPVISFNKPSLSFVPFGRYKVRVSGDIVLIMPDKHGNMLRRHSNRTALIYVGRPLLNIGDRDKTHHKLYRYKDGFAFRLSEEIKEGETCQE